MRCLIIFLVVFSIGCVTMGKHNWASSRSVGHVPCLQREMIVSDYRSGLTQASWLVKCKGKEYICAYTLTGGNWQYQIKCTRR